MRDSTTGRACKYSQQAKRNVSYFNSSSLTIKHHLGTSINQLCEPGDMNINDVSEHQFPLL